MLALIRRLLLRCPQCCRVLPRNLRCRGTGRSTISEHGGGATGGEQWTRRGYGPLRRLEADVWLTTKGAIATRLAMRSAESTNQLPGGGARLASRCPVPSLFLVASTKSDSGMWRRVCRRGRLALPRRVALHAGCFSDSRLPKTESRPHTRAPAGPAVRRCGSCHWTRQCPGGPQPARASVAKVPAGGGLVPCRHLRQAIVTRTPGPGRPANVRGLGGALGPLAGSGVQAKGTWAAGCAAKGRRSLAWGESGQRSMRITGGSCHGGGSSDSSSPASP